MPSGARVLLLSFLLFCLGGFSRCALASTTHAEAVAEHYAAQEVRSAPVDGNLPDDSLAPAQLVQARHLAHIHRVLHFAGEAWGLLQMLLVLQLGVAARLRDRALKAGRSRWVQGMVFVALLLGLLALLNLPLSVYGHHLSLRYGLSVQGWASWVGDWLKLLLSEWIGGVLLVMLLFLALRKMPRTWPLAFWVCIVLFSFAGAWGSPFFTQLFYRYEPLAQSQPDLVRRLEQVARRGGMDIPPERMFLMHASSKLTTPNADVEGLGSTKRVVVWDTTLQKLDPDQILFIFGHESGHYVLGHVRRGLWWSALGTLILLWAARFALRWSLARFGRTWQLHDERDWAVTVLLLLFFSLVGAVSEPLTAAFSRQQEHAADVYGQEAIHSLVADPQTAAQTAFVALGATSLDVPNPPRWIELWTFDHPATGWRAAFAHAYNPWLPGEAPRFFPPQPSTNEHDGTNTREGLSSPHARSVNRLPLLQDRRR